MNMKNIITVCARLLQKEELKGQGFLTITTAAGIIHGIPVLADYNGANLDEKLMIKILSDFCQSSAQNSLIGDEDVFMLRSVSIQQGDVFAKSHCILLRFDAILSVSISTSLPQ